MTDLLRPVFLTPAVAQRAVEHVILGLMASFNEIDGPDCHVLVKVVSCPPERHDASPEWLLLYEQSFGKVEEWKYSFRPIAHSKAHQLQLGQNDDRTDIMPHLLFRGDTVYWGGVRRHGIVVTISGFQPYFDKMASGMIADMCVGLAYHGWKKLSAREPGKSFV